MLLFIATLAYIVVVFIYFKTSHVTLYHTGIVADHKRSEFQNIPCYSLSDYPLKTRPHFLHISKHPMLLFIGSNCEIWAANRNFKTSHVTLYLGLITTLKRWFNNFKTSHVTLYQELCIASTRKRRFQNIPCYSLSNKIASFYNIPYGFQNIPCYSLSSQRSRNQEQQRYFKTSHVTLYLQEVHNGKES